MILNEELELRIKQLYLINKTKAEGELNKLKDKLYNTAKYVELKNNIGKIKFNIAKYQYNGDEKNVTLLANELKIQNEKLSIFLEEFKKNNNYSKPKYYCELCKDTGVLNNKTCSCYTKYLYSVLFEILGVKEINYTNIENTINNTFYNKIYNSINNYIDVFPKLKITNLLLIGNTGTGKTYLSKYIASKIFSKNYSPIFLSANELNNIFVKLHTTDIDKNLVINILEDCDLLIIDDLGTEPKYKNITNEYLLTLLSYRLEKDLPFIITTNLTLKEIKDSYTERLFSRLLDKQKTISIKFDGEDLRTKL